MISSSYLIASLIVILVPGIGAINVISTALTKNKTHMIASICGCTTALFLHINFGIIGMVLARFAHSILFNIIQWLGLIYLAYIGYGMIKNRHQQFSDQKCSGNASLRKTYINAITINILNPKTTLFFISFLPQFIDVNSGNIVLKAYQLGLVFALMTFIVFFMYGLLASYFNKYLVQNTKALSMVNLVFGCLFILLSISLVIDLI